jgi:hypothetical protein
MLAWSTVNFAAGTHPALGPDTENTTRKVGSWSLHQREVSWGLDVVEQLPAASKHLMLL